jgi:hypothetical protein
MAAETGSIQATVEIDAETVSACMEFSGAVEQSNLDFENPDLTRDRQDVVADTITGKLAEVAVQRFLRQLGISLVLDFRLLPDGCIDAGDVYMVAGQGSFVHSSVRLDVKGTSDRGRWLLVERGKFQCAFERPDHTAFALVKMLRCGDLQWPGHDVLRRGPGILWNTPVTALVAGYAWGRDFFADAEMRSLWFDLPAGSILPHASAVPPRSASLTHARLAEILASADRTGTVLKQSNAALPDHWLRRSPRDWSDLARRLAEGARVDAADPRLAGLRPSTLWITGRR